jgi:shikimate kinase
MGVGKSTIGLEVAKHLGVRFADLDVLVGDVTGLFMRGGEDAFRQRESAALREAAAGDGVLALGGGTLTTEENRITVGAWNVVVLLARPSTLEMRMTMGQQRPLAWQWRELLEARTPGWLRYGEPIWVDGLDVNAVTEQVLARC